MVVPRSREASGVLKTHGDEGGPRQDILEFLV